MPSKKDECYNDPKTMQAVWTIIPISRDYLLNMRLDVQLPQPLDQSSKYSDLLTVRDSLSGTLSV